MAKFTYDCKVSVDNLKRGPQTMKQECEVVVRDVGAYFDNYLY